MAKHFSRETLEKFEAAAASIPMRQLDRAFAAAGIRLGADPGGPDGTRRVQFRRYVASLDQKKADHVKRLGSVLGALIGEVADSKQEYLVRAAATDGFAYAGGIFQSTTQHAGAKNAVRDQARERVEAACREALTSLGTPAPAKSSSLRALLAATLAALDPSS